MRIFFPKTLYLYISHSKLICLNYSTRLLRDVLFDPKNAKIVPSITIKRFFFVLIAFVVNLRRSFFSKKCK